METAMRANLDLAIRTDVTHHRRLRMIMEPIRMTKNRIREDNGETWFRPSESLHRKNPRPWGFEPQRPPGLFARNIIFERLRAVRKTAKIDPWPQDAPRRTFASNWLAIKHDVNRLNN